MENIALIESFSEFKDDKLIDRVTLMAILEDVFRNALKKKYGSDDNFDIIINPDKGDMEIWRNRVVVADGEVEDQNSEISLSEARKIEPDFEVGEIMIQDDHINMFPEHPLLGKNFDELGPRFPDMSEPYDRKMIEMAKGIAAERMTWKGYGFSMPIAPNKFEDGKDNPEVSISGTVTAKVGLGSSGVGTDLVALGGGTITATVDLDLQDGQEADKNKIRLNELKTPFFKLPDSIDDIKISAKLNSEININITLENALRIIQASLDNSDLHHCIIQALKDKNLNWAVKIVDGAYQFVEKQSVPIKKTIEIVEKVSRRDPLSRLGKWIVEEVTTFVEEIVGRDELI